MLRIVEKGRERHSTSLSVCLEVPFERSCNGSHHHFVVRSIIVCRNTYMANTGHKTSRCDVVVTSHPYQ